MNQIPDALYGYDRATWLIIGASRGLGLEFVHQLLKRNAKVLATVREVYASHASSLWAAAGNDHGRCQILVCDVLSEENINTLVATLCTNPKLKIDNVVIAAGVLHYPKRATGMSFQDFAFHLHTNAIGPIICAQRLLQSRLPIGRIVFLSSDSSSADRFRETEDGFAAFAASKAALNQAARHMAAELKRADDDTVILVLYPGEVNTAHTDGYQSDTVDGIITARESVKGMIEVIESKGVRDSGTFWTWEGDRHPW